MPLFKKLASLIAGHFNWEEWERYVRSYGYTLDRPYRSIHPQHAEMIYPIDYGYINGTMSSDNEGIDIFVGSIRNGLVALALTSDLRKDDREYKLIYDASPEEIYLIHGFLNFDRSLMRSRLVMRYPMHRLWDELPAPTVG